MKKLTLVSVTYLGRTVSVFINLPYVNGSPNVNNKTLDGICKTYFGFTIPNNHTFSI